MSKLYLENFIFPSLDEDNLVDTERMGSFYDEDCYPYHIMSEMGLFRLDFEPLTILYGGNGSGKSTIINVIGEKFCAARHSAFNTSYHFKSYVDKCQFKVSNALEGDCIFGERRSPKKYDIQKITTVLTSDDIFHWMLDSRIENDKKLHKSQYLFEDYKLSKDESLPKHIDFQSGYNVEKFMQGVEMKKARRGKGSFNQYLLKTVGKMERGFSNGETALMKLCELIEKPGLYLLDEPENSMSCEYQIKLAAIIEYLALYGDCQFVISTHSPFMLSLAAAKIYNLDNYPATISKWWELENMQKYFQLFYDERENFTKAIKQ